MWLFLLFFIHSAFAVNVWQDELKPTFQEAGEGDQLLILAGGVAGMYATQPYDGKIRDFRNDDGNLLIGKEESHRIDNLTYGILQVGTAVPLLFADTKEGVRLSKALILTSLSHLTLAHIIQRERPNHRDSLSLPSGHTSSMFAYAGTLAGSYGWKAGVPAYLAASLTALSRIKEDQHWASDVVAGMFLGTYWASVVHGEKSATYTVVPTAVNGGMMITFIRAW